MRLRLRTKFTLVMTSLVLLVVAVLSCLFAAQLLEQLIRETDKRANDFAHQVFQQAQQALVEAKQFGLRPGSDAPEEIRDYVRHAFEISEGLQTQLKDAATENPLIYEVSIADTDGLVLASSDDTLLGRFQPRRASLSELIGRSFLHQMKVLFVPPKRADRNPQLFEVEYPFKKGNKPFGEVRVVMVSPSAEQFLGAPSGQFLGRRVTDIFPPGHPLHDALRIEGDELSEIAAETDLETSGGPKRVNVSVQAIQEDGERIGALVTLRDLDSLESIDTQLKVSERLAALGKITAGVAHEVQNPLNSMRLWLENLKESLSFDGDNSSARQAVQVLDKEIDRLDQVVKRFLDFTRPMDVRLEATQLADLLKEVLEIAKPQLEKSNIQLAQLLPIDVPEVYVDRALLKQAVLNLVLNAAEAMPNGGQLRLVLSRRGEMAEITVGDTGKGIPPENQQKIFQLFFTTRPGGSGIGLASTFRIVQLHNGSINFTSEVGRGTTFRIELPLAA